VTQKRGEPDVPDVEVTYDRSRLPVLSPERPVAARRSGAKNVSDPKYQNAFISEARLHSGQPTRADCEALLGQEVTLVFNIDWHDATGVLTEIRETVTTYLILDGYRERLYPLNAIQEIRRG
jgi:hypothetical protein